MLTMKIFYKNRYNYKNIVKKKKKINVVRLIFDGFSNFNKASQFFNEQPNYQENY